MTVAPARPATAPAAAPGGRDHGLDAARGIATGIGLGLVCWAVILLPLLWLAGCLG